MRLDIHSRPELTRSLELVNRTTDQVIRRGLPKPGAASGHVSWRSARGVVEAFRRVAELFSPTARGYWLGSV